MSLLLAGSLCLLPFLLPYHQQPVLSFFPEWLAAALGIAAALTLLAGQGVSAASLPVPARWLFAFALVLAVQAAIGGHAYSQLPLLAALYVLYAVLMIWLGAQLTAALGIERVATVLAALLFLWLRVQVRTAYALPALILLTLGSALSGSRGALLYALWYAALGMMAVRVQDSAETRQLRSAAYAVAGATLAAHFALPWLNSALQLGSPGEGTFDRMLVYLGESARREVALLALRMFSDA